MPERSPRASVIVAAHNEESVLDGCLSSLLQDAAPDELEIVVAANGCTDGTVAVARAHPGVQVVELPRPGKTAALNAAEQVATSFPRVYLDADIRITPRQIRALCAAVTAPAVARCQPAPLAACPRRRMDLRGRPLLVRGYTVVNQRLPAFASGLFGRGVVVLSAAGRARFGTFPSVIADDLFLDSLFVAAEKCQVQEVEVVVEAPLSTADLLRRLERVRRGNRMLREQLKARGTSSAAPSRPLTWLTHVVLRRPWLAPAAIIYATITLIAELRSRRGGPVAWGRDESTRAARPPQDGDESRAHAVRRP